MTRVRSQLRLLSVSLALALAAAACGGPAPSATPEASPTAAPSAPAASPSPTSPSASPGGSGDPNAALYERIEGEVRELRGLSVATDVGRQVLDEAGLQAFVIRSFGEDNPPELVAAQERLYQGLLLLPPDASLRDLYVDLLTSQILGLYDDETNQMYVVARTGEIGPLEEVTYAHEFTHALQDAAFDLDSVRPAGNDQGDATLAAITLVEGDAMLAMALWAREHLTPEQLAEAAGAGGPAGEDILARTPAILRETLMFPYTAGLTLAFSAQLSGGWAAVDALYAAPPQSTEQVLHADKLRAREAPVAVAFPEDLASRLGGGWTVTAQDTLGEFQLGLWLREAAGAAQASSEDAAAGWGGDRVALLDGPAGATAVVLDTSWDTNADATAFAAAAEAVVARLAAAGRSGAVLRPAPDRVVVISADGSDTVGRVANVLGLAG